MAVKSASLSQEKHLRGMQSGGESYKAGVMAVTESPMQKAADNADKWFAGIQRAFTDGTWVAGLLSVSLSEWKSKTSGEGATRWQSSATEASQNYGEFIRQFTPHLERVQNDVEQMPSLNLDDNIARMVFNARENAKFTYVKN